jgi:hypothetical protein
MDLVEGDQNRVFVYTKTLTEDPFLFRKFFNSLKIDIINHSNDFDIFLKNKF